MPVVAPNGFCLFAQELRNKITGHRHYCRDDLISPYLVRIVTPLWERLTTPFSLKLFGIEDNCLLLFYSATVAASSNRGKSEKLDEFDENDYPEDLMIGIPLNQKDYDSEGELY
uniref:Uncharacterized protein n=1 Tax=Setaria digitata TaxID=48799 RepID=A0A915Q341_9BILA